ncbi:hypothetical protein VTL71DRAFT_4559 [Oculimacula yallundae]|uniref:BZIP domain-containing protein n=1 Tax=Oculimacula yallundae TaxID=86028 RepID=A0ABR4C2B1_9HELO
MPRATPHVIASAKSDIWQSDVWKLDDDWKEVDSKEEKKRRQNRINQRAYRRRNPANEKPAKQRPFRVERFRIPDKSVLEKRPDRVIVLEASKSDVIADQIENCDTPDLHLPSECHDHVDRFEAVALQNPINSLQDAAVQSGMDAIYDVSAISSASYNNVLLTSGGQAKASLEVVDPYGSITTTSSLITSTPQTWMQDSHQDYDPRSTSQTGHFHSRDPDGQTLFRISFEQLISLSSRKNTILNSNTIPLNPTGFPLSSDHLLHLIHFNVFRGLITNKSILRGRTLQSKINLDILLPNCRNLCDGLALIRSKPGQVIPSSLNPTYVQASIAHSSWMNMFPFPAIRDNLIKAEKDFDHEELCFDLFGEMISSWTLDARPALQEVRGWDDDNEGEFTARRKGLILWGEPWDKNAWEVTPGFIQKWAWLLRNCDELIDSTNRWRSMRDENPLAYPFVVVSEECISKAYMQNCHAIVQIEKDMYWSFENREETWLGQIHVVDRKDALGNVVEGRERMGRNDLR